MESRIYTVFQWFMAGFPLPRGRILALKPKYTIASCTSGWFSAIPGSVACPIGADALKFGFNSRADARKSGFNERGDARKLGFNEKSDARNFGLNEGSDATIFGFNS